MAHPSVRRAVSVLFNEPKLLKFKTLRISKKAGKVSVLFNEPKLLKSASGGALGDGRAEVSVLFNEPKLLKSQSTRATHVMSPVSVLFNEPKLLKFDQAHAHLAVRSLFQCSSTSRNC